MAKINIGALDRLMRIQAARHLGAEQLQEQTDAIAQELIGAALNKDEAVRPRAYPDTGYMTPYEATVSFAVEVHRAISWHASNMGRPAPELTKYHPAYATPAMFKDVWEARQLCDSVGLPYFFFAQQAVMHWESLRKDRLPRPTQLCSPNVMAHVASLWADPYTQHHYPLPCVATGALFDPELFTGDSVQMRVLRLLEARIGAAGGLGSSANEVLSDALDVTISESTARTYFDESLVDDALRLRSTREIEASRLFFGVVNHDADEEGDAEVTGV